MEGFEKRLRDDIEQGARRFDRRRFRHRSATGGFVFGIAIVAIGSIMLLDNLGIMRARDFWDYAPLLLAAVGIGKILECQGRPAGTVFGGLLTVAGTLWFLDNIDVLRFDHRLVVPIVIIGFGLMFLVRALDRARGLASPDGPAVAEAQINIWTVFGGSKRVVDAKDFRSADLFAMFGGIDLDLRQASLAEGATIDANAMFGGVEIRVPLNWSVEVRGSGIFGGYEDKTVHPAMDSLAPTPKLVITGFAVFGGVSVSNA
jgi:predicted membrane protein